MLFGRAYRKCQTVEIVPKAAAQESANGVSENERDVPNIGKPSYQIRPTTSEPGNPAVGSPKVLSEAGNHSPSLLQTQSAFYVSLDIIQQTNELMQETYPPRINLLDIVMREEREKENLSATPRSDPIVTPFQFSPVPTSKKRSSDRGCWLGRSEIISSSSYGKELTEAENRRQLKNPVKIRMKTEKRKSNEERCERRRDW